MGAASEWDDVFEHQSRSPVNLAIPGVRKLQPAGYRVLLANKAMGVMQPRGIEMYTTEVGANKWRAARKPWHTWWPGRRMAFRP